MLIRKNFQGQGERIILTVGFYDGIHLGHQQIIKYLVEKAKEIQSKSCLLTFNFVSDSCFSLTSFPFLTTWPEKREVFEKLGLDMVNLFSFTPQFKSLSPECFLNELTKNYQIAEIAVGEDFAFGRNREGNIEWLRKAQKRFSFALTVLPHLRVNGEKISSSGIRRLIKEGKVNQAGSYLGHYPTIIGEVIKGQGRGQKMGFPTANVRADPQKLLPAPAVYAGQINYKGKTFKAIVNVGNRPTFQDNSFGVEAHILGFHRQIRGETISLELISKIRQIQQFSTFLDLVKRLNKDKRFVEEMSA